jgi:hypothetical protein
LPKLFNQNANFKRICLYEENFYFGTFILRVQYAALGNSRKRANVIVEIAAQIQFFVYGGLKE